MRLKNNFKHINLAQVVAGISFLFGISTCCAAAPCDFRGVSVGDKLTQKQLMAKLGIKHFRLNPRPDLWLPTKDDERRYGYLGAQDVARWRVGPFCLLDACYIPYGVEIEAKVPAFVEIVYGGNDTITDIWVQFNSRYWEKVAPTLIQKYGLNWDAEKDHNFVIADEVTQKSVTVDRTVITNKSGGVNDKTKGHCEISAANYNAVFLPHSRLGPYRSFLGIDMIQDCKEQSGCQGHNARK